MSAHSPSTLTLAFGEPTGQGWAQIGLFGIAVGLSLLIGIERESKQKSAGVRTYTLVGAGSALFMLISKYGFTDVLGEHTVVDPSRVAAQIVSGVGFIGGGLIFVRRDAVRGLTTAASVWLTAALGAAAGAGLPVLAVVGTGTYFLAVFGTRPIADRLSARRPDRVSVVVAYLDGRGLLRRIITHCNEAGFAVENLATVAYGRTEQLAARSGDVGESPPDPEGIEVRKRVQVSLTLTGRGDLQQVSSVLADEPGVLSLLVPAPSEDD